MKTRRVRLTATARAQLGTLETWWKENSARPEILAIDLDGAFRMVSIAPGIGSSYPASPIPGTRRLFLKRLLSHVYYTYDDQQVIVRAIWHTRRGVGPSFGGE